MEGTAANAKLGAVLQDKESAIWIEGVEAWPSEFCSGGDHGKRLRVTGTVIEKHDLPVFVQPSGEPASAGIPVLQAKEEDRARRRYLLQDAKWTVLE